VAAEHSSQASATPRRPNWHNRTSPTPGLGDLVDLRSGDALHTLANIAEPINLVFLDGRNDLYLPILHLLEPRLLPSGLVVADLSADDPDLLAYLEYVREPACGYFSMTVPLDDGVELSTRVGDGRP
jgi:predicted O-methyltransferase YrrM